MRVFSCVYVWCVLCVWCQWVVWCQLLHSSHTTHIHKIWHPYARAMWGVTFFVCVLSAAQSVMQCVLQCVLQVVLQRCRGRCACDNTWTKKSCHTYTPDMPHMRTSNTTHTHKRAMAATQACMLVVSSREPMRCKVALCCIVLHCVTGWCRVLQGVAVVTSAATRHVAALQSALHMW